MDEISIRCARVDDADWVVETIYAMVTEMSRYGGQTPDTAEHARERLARPIAEQLVSSDACYLLAQSTAHERLGLVGAAVTTLGGTFVPRPQLHISAVYVTPQARGRGIAGRLLSALWDWGREKGCVACDLNVVAGNPARSLYEKLGFAVSHFRMLRPL